METYDNFYQNYSSLKRLVKAAEIFPEELKIMEHLENKYLKPNFPAPSSPDKKDNSNQQHYIILYYIIDKNIYLMSENNLFVYVKTLNDEKSTLMLFEEFISEIIQKIESLEELILKSHGFLGNYQMELFEEYLRKFNQRFKRQYLKY